MDSNITLQEAQNITVSFQDWFNNRVRPLAYNQYPLEFDSWKKELELIQSRIDQPNRLRIALVGTTGAGKSTFLNAVLGQQLLPVSVMSPCTAFVTTVSNSSEGGFRVTVQFCTKEEWEHDLQSLIAALQPGDEEEDDGQRESNRLIEAAKKRLKAVFGEEIFNTTEIANLNYEILPTEIKDIFSNSPSQHDEFVEPKEMLNYLRKLVRRENSLWPLIKEVRINGPYPCLEGGLEIVDLPGLNDPNEARVEITREYLHTSPFVWILFPMVRGITEDIRKILYEEKLLRMLILSGVYHSLSLVGTKADDIDFDNANQFALPEDSELIDLIRAYRKKTIAEARRQLEEMIREIALPGDDQETINRLIDTAKHLKIHTTSASAYCKIMNIAPLRRDYGIKDILDTGIPDIHEHLTEIKRGSCAMFMVQTASKRLDQLASEIEFFFSCESGGSLSPDGTGPRPISQRTPTVFSRHPTGQAARQYPTRNLPETLSGENGSAFCFERFGSNQRGRAVAFHPLGDFTSNRSAGRCL